MAVFQNQRGQSTDGEDDEGSEQEEDSGVLIVLSVSVD